MIKCYIAGRIEYSRKRFGIVECSLNSDVGVNSPVAHLTPFVFRGDKMIYTGPYTMGCDHSCSHMSEPRFGTVNHGSGKTCMDEIKPHQFSEIAPIVFKRSLDGVRQANFVFAWIKDLECYGTLVEIGYALGRNIPVIVGFPKNFTDKNELWFVSQGAIVVYGDTPEDAFEMAVVKYKSWVIKK
jgi:hypothetical protein